MRFQFDETKAVEALAYIANNWDGVTMFFTSKVLFFAEKAHLNKYARPIVADTFIAMPNGPVPSMIYDFVQGKLGQSGDPDAFRATISIADYPKITASRAANTDVFSPSDLKCLDAAIEFCKSKSFGKLSDLTHKDASWINAGANAPMGYEDMVDCEDRDSIIEEAREFAAYGVL